MKCERTQELLLTDYTDGELGEKARREVDEHIGLCATCRELKQAVTENAGRVRGSTGEGQVPAYIWERVKAEISVEPVAQHGILADVSDGIKRVFSVLGRIPKPALAFAAVVMIIIAVFVTRPSPDAGVDAYLAEQMNFMVGLDTVEGNGNGFFDTDLRTSAENIL